MSDQKTQILGIMKKVICDQLDVQASAVTEKAAFVDDLGADSLALVELVLAFEEKFGVTIPDTEADKLVTVGDAIQFVIDHGGSVRGESVSAA